MDTFDYRMKREETKSLINYIQNIVSLLVEWVVFAYIWYANYAYNIQGQFYRRGNWAVIGLFLLIMFLFTRTLGGYHTSQIRMSDAMISHSLAIVFCYFVEYFVICLITRDYIVPHHLVIGLVITLAIVNVWQILIKKIYHKLCPPHDMLLIYGDHEQDLFLEKIATHEDKYNVKKQVKYDIDETRLINMLSDYNAVLLFDLPSDDRNRILKICYTRAIRVYITPKISDIIFRGADDIHLLDSPLLLARNCGLSIGQRFVKRAIDIVFSLIGIIVLSPLFIILAIAIKCYDGGPVLFKQIRMTLGGHDFLMYKFRSMAVTAEEDGARLAAKDDERVTPVGKIIRNLHIDELPQLFNVLKGDMAIVGPRPERREIAEVYTQDIAEFNFRTKVKAGLTGFAQVYGKYNTLPYDKLKMDLTYIENYSLWLDFKILLLTIKVLFRPEHTEGVDKEQRTAVK